MARWIDDEEEVKGDMTPMIDIIFLLLIFFLLTTKFIPEEMIISSLLPTNKGQAQTSVEIVPKEDVNVAIFPQGMPRNLQPSEYQRLWEARYDARNAVIRVGNHGEIEITGSTLGQRGGGALNESLDQVHSYIFTRLQAMEVPGASRKDQNPVVIHCFSGMPWMFPLAVYDAIRAYESINFDFGTTRARVDQMAEAREINFAPPRIRAYRQWEMGYELQEIIHMN